VRENSFAEKKVGETDSGYDIDYFSVDSSVLLIRELLGYYCRLVNASRLAVCTIISTITSSKNTNPESYITNMVLVY
jgi:hypothetical protein